MPETDKLARYRTISRLGAGGMAVVELAEDTLLGRQVALKRMTVTEDAHGGLRLRREALMGASISHPNLVSVYDVVGEEDGNLVIVMEYVEGENLAEALARRGRLAPAKVLSVIQGVAAGLDAIHKQGIVHRDVKPPNVLLGARDTVKLADLGVASAPDHTRLTSSGAIVGSLRYMAPEQVENAESTKAIDIYALAAVTFEALSGTRARRETNPLALAHAIATKPPPDLREAWPGAPAAAAELLHRAMSRDPAKRPGSAGELASRLGQILDPQPTAQIPVAISRSRDRSPTGAAAPATESRRVHVGAEKERPWRPLGAAAALVALAAAVIAVVVSTTGGTHKRQTGGTHHGASGGTARSATGGAGASSAASGSTTASNPTSAAAASGNPINAVESFYKLGAAHNFPAAWALADSAFRAQLAGYQNFQAGQQPVRAVSIDSARVTSQSGNTATVAVRTTSTHTDGPHHCSGTVDVNRDGASGAWLLHQIQINCT